MDDPKQARVYVTQETSHNFRPAEEFGELVFLSSDRRDDFHNVVNSDHNRRLMAHLRYGLRKYDAERDYLVLVGSPYVNAAVMTMLGMRKIRTVRILRWDNRDMVYIPLVLNFETETIDG